MAISVLKPEKILRKPEELVTLSLHHFVGLTPQLMGPGAQVRLGERTGRVIGWGHAS